MLEVMAARDENTSRWHAAKRLAPLHYGGAVQGWQGDEMAQISREFKEIRDSIIACQRQNTLAGIGRIRETSVHFLMHWDACRKIPRM